MDQTQAEKLKRVTKEISDIFGKEALTLTEVGSLAGVQLAFAFHQDQNSIQAVMAFFVSFVTTVHKNNPGMIEIVNAGQLGD